jgi:dihydrofolate reductase
MFNIIVAYDKNRGIAREGQLPWPLNKTDMNIFKVAQKQTHLL